MRFAREHRLDGDPAAVARLLTDAGFHTALELPDVAPAQVVSTCRAGAATVLRLRYVFTGSLDPIARRLLGGHELAWIQDLTVADDASGGNLVMWAERDRHRLHGSANFELAGNTDGSTGRHLSGEIVVAVPVIGRGAEGRLVPGILARLDREADALNESLKPS